MLRIDEAIRWCASSPPSTPKACSLTSSPIGAAIASYSSKWLSVGLINQESPASCGGVLGAPNGHCRLAGEGDNMQTETASEQRVVVESLISIIPAKGLRLVHLLAVVFKASSSCT
jgi:hypothetical protein